MEAPEVRRSHPKYE